MKSKYSSSSSTSNSSVSSSCSTKIYLYKNIHSSNSNMKNELGDIDLKGLLLPGPGYIPDGMNRYIDNIDNNNINNETRSNDDTCDNDNDISYNNEEY